MAMTNPATTLTSSEGYIDHFDKTAEQLRQLTERLENMQERLDQVYEQQRGLARTTRDTEASFPVLSSPNPLWSTVFLQGDVRHSELGGSDGLFSYPTGHEIPPGTGQRSSHIDTNLREGGRIPSSMDFHCTGMHLALWGTKEEVDALVPHLSFAWDYTQVRTEIPPLTSWWAMGADSEGVRQWQYFADATPLPSMLPGSTPFTPWRVPSNYIFAVLTRVGRLPKPLENGVMLRMTLHGKLGLSADRPRW